MTFDPKEARALVERLTGFMPGPWFDGTTDDDRRLIMSFDDNYVCNVQIHQTPRHMGLHYEEKRNANADLILAAPRLHAALTAALAEIERLREALESIISMTDQIAMSPTVAERWADRIEDVSRAALKVDDQ